MENQDEVTEIQMSPTEFMDLFYDSWIRMIDLYSQSEEENPNETTFVMSTSMIATLAYFIEKILTNNVDEKDRKDFIKLLMGAIETRTEFVGMSEENRIKTLEKAKEDYNKMLSQFKNEASESHNHSDSEKPKEVQE